MRYWMLVLMVLGLGGMARGSESHETLASRPSAGHVEAAVEEAEADTPPLAPAPSAWPGVMVMVILTMFVLALAAGMTIRATQPEAEANGDDAHGHDDHGQDAHGHDAHGHH